MKLFQPPKEFRNYFRIISATFVMLGSIFASCNNLRNTCWQFSKCWNRIISDGRRGKL